MKTTLAVKCEQEFDKYFAHYLSGVTSDYMAEELRRRDKNYYASFSPEEILLERSKLWEGEKTRFVEGRKEIKRKRERPNPIFIMFEPCIVSFRKIIIMLAFLRRHIALPSEIYSRQMESIHPTHFSPTEIYYILLRLIPPFAEEAVSTLIETEDTLLQERLHDALAMRDEAIFCQLLADCSRKSIERLLAVCSYYDGYIVDRLSRKEVDDYIKHVLNGKILTNNQKIDFSYVDNFKYYNRLQKARWKVDVLELCTRNNDIRFTDVEIEAVEESWNEIWNDLYEELMEIPVKHELRQRVIEDLFFSDGIKSFVSATPKQQQEVLENCSEEEYNFIVNYIIKVGRTPKSFKAQYRGMNRTEIAAVMVALNMLGYFVPKDIFESMILKPQEDKLNEVIKWLQSTCQTDWEDNTISDFKEAVRKAQKEYSKREEMRTPTKNVRNVQNALEKIGEIKRVHTKANENGEGEE